MIPKLLLWAGIASSVLVIAASVYYALSPDRDSQVIKLALMSFLLVPAYVFIMPFFRPATQLVTNPNTVLFGLMLASLLILPFAVVFLLARELLGSGAWVWIIMYLYPITIGAWGMSKDQIGSEIKFIGLSYFACFGIAALVSFILGLFLADVTPLVDHYQQQVYFLQNSGDETIVYVIAALVFANIFQIKTIFNNSQKLFHKT